MGRTRTLIAAALAAAAATATGVPRALEEMVAAERAFAAAALEDGIRESFLAFSVEEAVIYRPGAVPVRDWFRDRPDPAGRLLWSPATAEVSSGGDLGYTFGPWRFVDERDESLATGQFFTVWQRQADGAWRWLVDIGTVHPPEAGAGDLELKAPREISTEAIDAAAGERAEAELAAAERRFAAASGAEAAGYRDHAAADLALLRQGSPPLRGREAALAALAAGPRAASWRVEASGLARSADLAYARGVVEWSAPGDAAGESSGSFVRVWRRAPGGGWEIAVDAVVPLPATDP